MVRRIMLIITRIMARRSLLMSAALLLFATVLSLAAKVTRAAQVAVVDVDGTSFLDGPQKGATIVLKLKKGTRLDVSNYPTEGYYKARTMDHKLGWVKADTLDLQQTKQAPEDAAPSQ